CWPTCARYWITVVSRFPHVSASPAITCSSAPSSKNKSGHGLLKTATPLIVAGPDHCDPAQFFRGIVFMGSNSSRTNFIEQQRIALEVEKTGCEQTMQEA